MSARTIQQLPAAIEHLRAWASAKGIAWVPGRLSEAGGELPTVGFAHHDGAPQPLASAEAFSRTLDALDVAMLVVSIVILHEEAQQAAVALYEAEPEVVGGPTANEMNAMTRSLLSDAREARKHVGEPGRVLVSAITRNPAVAIQWSATTDWYIPIEASELVYDEMDDMDVGPDPDDDEWEEIEPEPEPPVPPRRRISPRR